VTLLEAATTMSGSSRSTPVTGYAVDDPHTSQTSNVGARRQSESLNEEDEPLLADIPANKRKKDVVTWRSLPHKRQLAILTIARFAEPIVQSSLRVSPFSLTRMVYLTLIVISLLPIEIFRQEPP
jgi:hypothetical protein